MSGKLVRTDTNYWNNRDVPSDPCIFGAIRKCVKPQRHVSLGSMMRPTLTKFAPPLELKPGFWAVFGDVAEWLKAAVC
jgi:hypothetical protein